VLDTMPARNLNSNFEKLPVWFVNILDKGSRGIFVTKKDEVLQICYFKFEVWSLFRIPTLSDVCVGFLLEFLLEISWLS
jgi:hypothetical protein